MKIIKNITEDPRKIRQNGKDIIVMPGEEMEILDTKVINNSIFEVVKNTYEIKDIKNKKEVKE